MLVFCGLGKSREDKMETRVQLWKTIHDVILNGRIFCLAGIRSGLALHERW